MINNPHDPSFRSLPAPYGTGEAESSRTKRTHEQTTCSPLTGVNSAQGDAGEDDWLMVPSSTSQASTRGTSEESDFCMDVDDKDDSDESGPSNESDPRLANCKEILKRIGEPIVQCRLQRNHDNCTFCPPSPNSTDALKVKASKSRKEVQDREHAKKEKARRGVAAGLIAGWGSRIPARVYGYPYVDRAAAGKLSINQKRFAELKYLDEIQARGIQLEEEVAYLRRQLTIERFAQQVTQMEVEALQRQRAPVRLTPPGSPATPTQPQ